MKKIFLIDDDEDFLTNVKLWGKSNGYNVTTFAKSEGVLDALIQQEPEIVLVDINLKTDDGRLISEDLKNILPFPVKVILISADANSLKDFKSHYADDILIKPFSFSELQAKLN